MSKVIYICSEAEHNKFWNYDIDGNTVTIEWGRIGGTSDRQVKYFSSGYELSKFVDKKVREKLAKGYKPVAEQTLNKETETASMLGAQNKIKRMLWVSKHDDELTQLNSYDPRQYVYIEILNSWSKEITRLLLSKEKTWLIDEGITESGRSLYLNGMHETRGYSNVRQVLREMSEVIAEAIKTVKVAALGVRNLMGEEDFSQQPEYTEALASVNTSGFDDVVIHKFATMGMRTIEL